MARAMLPSMNLLYRSGAELAPLAERGGERIGRLARIAIKTARWLLDLNLVAGSHAIRSSVGYAKSVRRRISVYGYPRLSRLEQELIDAYAADGSALYLPYYPGNRLFADNDAAKDLFQTRGWRIEQHLDEGTTVGRSAASSLIGQDAAPSGVRALSFATPEAEARSVLRTIKAGIAERQFLPEDVVIVTRSEGVYGPLVREAAWEFGIPVQTHHAISFMETRLGSWFYALLELSGDGRFPFEGTARIVRHALGGGLVRPTWAQDGWSSARATHVRGAPEWEPLGIDIPLLAWPESALRSKWCDLMFELLERAEVMDLCARRPQDISAYDVLRDSLTELRTAVRSGDPERTRSEFVEELRDTLSVATIPFSGRRAGIQIHTPLSLYGSEVQHVFVLGVGEGLIPKLISDDTHFDFHDRTRLKRQGLIRLDPLVTQSAVDQSYSQDLLESAAQAARRETLSFYALLLTASRSLTLSFPRLQGDGEGRPSAFISRMRIDIEDDPGHGLLAASVSDLLQFTLPVEACSSSETLAWEIREDVRARWAIVKNRERADVIDSYSGSVGPDAVPQDHLFSPSQIMSIGQCPYKWFAQSVLRLGDPDEAEDDLAADVKGSLFHATLRNAVEGARGAVDLRAAIQEGLEQAFDLALAADPRTTAPGMGGAQG